jgi:hypothetical protein
MSDFTSKDWEIGYDPEMMTIIPITYNRRHQWAFSMALMVTIGCMSGEMDFDGVLFGFGRNFPRSF